MSLTAEYVKKKLGVQGLKEELIRLIKEYNEIRGTYLFVFSSAMEKTQF